MTLTTLRIVPRLRLLLACLFMLGASVIVGAAKGPSVQVLTFTIDGMTSPPNAVFSDSPDGYKDYRLASGANTDPNYCVEASPANSGFTFIRLNRKLDGDAGSMYCGLFGGVGATPRQYSVRIAAADACLEAFTNGYANTPEAGCIFTGNDKPRIRLANLYANRAKSTPVALLSEFYSNPNGVSYEIRTNTDATVTTWAGNTNIRMVHYTGTARLVKFSPGMSATTVASAFPLPFHMTFQRSGI